MHTGFWACPPALTRAGCPRGTLVPWVWLDTTQKGRDRNAYEAWSCSSAAECVCEDLGSTPRATRTNKTYSGPNKRIPNNL